MSSRRYRRKSHRYRTAAVFVGTVVERGSHSGNADVYEFAPRRRHWNPLTRLLEPFKMKFDRFLNETKYLFPGICCRRAAGQIWDVCAEIFLACFYNDQVFHSDCFS